MAGNDPARFDYLFEPIDGDLEGAGGDVVADPVAGPSRRRVPRSLWAVMAATVLGAGVGLVILLPSADAGQSPPGVTPTTPTAPTAPPVPVPTSSPVEESPSEVTPPPEPTVMPEPAPTLDRRTPPPTPALPPPSPAPEPRQVPAPTTIIRPPISVSPEPRPAFPSQKPGDGSDNRGVLGGLL